MFNCFKASIMTIRTGGFTAALSLGLLVLSGCTSNEKDVGDPKQRLTDYINKSFAVKSTDDRRELLSYLAGDAKARLGAWSEDQFRQAFLEQKRQFIRLVFQEVKSISPKEVNITYELSYLDQAKGKDAKVTNKKFAQMVQEGETWMIADVKNIKELIEYKDEMSLP